MVPDRLRFGTAGIPLSAMDRNTEGGIKRVRELGLECMELEFVRNINISLDNASKIKHTASKEDIMLTCHAPYFINLNAIEKEKIDASIGRIEKSAKVLHACGGWSVCFHPGFYLKMEKQAVFLKIKENIKKIRNDLDEQGIDVWLRPETTGKETQFGNHRELLSISQEMEGVMPVFDFSHIHARTGGKYNTPHEFREIMGDIESYLGKEGLANMHIHLSGINYSEKGERNHLRLIESDMKYAELIEIWKEFNIKGCVISESPNIEKDAMLMQKTYMGER